jgi:hypothetical protein
MKKNIMTDRKGFIARIGALIARKRLELEAAKSSVAEFEILPDEIKVMGQFPEVFLTEVKRIFEADMGMIELTQTQNASGQMIFKIKVHR